MPNWLTGLLAVASVLFGGGGLAVIIKTVVEAFTGRRGRGAEVADRLSDSSLKWVQEFQEEAAAAREETRQHRAETAEARREVANMRVELADVHRQAEGLARDLRDLRGAIMAPEATVERLRLLVGGGDPGTNGRY
jgi:chromosome segregation ATPase